MNKQAELTRWTPKRLLSLLMALIMTLSLLPTAAFAFGDGETNTIDASTVALAPTRNHVADGTIEGTNTKFSLLFSIGSKEVSKPGERVNVTAYADLEEGSGDDVEMTKVLLTDNKTTYGDKSWAQTKASSILGYPKVGDDGSADFTISVEYVVNGTTIGSKSVRVVIKNLWTGYNITFTAPEGLTGVKFTGGIPENGKAKTSFRDEEKGDFTPVYTIPATADAILDGYTFEGWTFRNLKTADGSVIGGTVAAGANYTYDFGSDATFTAELYKNQQITFDAGDYGGVTGILNKVQYSRGTKYDITVQDPKLDGYQFTGWLQEGTSYIYHKGGTVAGITSATKLIAQWTPDDGSAPVGSHKVTFLAGAADAYIPFVATATVKDGETYQIPTAVPTREGYTFEGWSDGTNTYQAGAAISGVTKDIVLSAKWTATPVMVQITNLGAADGVKVINLTPNSSIGSEAHFTVQVPDKYNTSDLLVYAGDPQASYRMLAPVERVELKNTTTGVVESVMLYYQFTVTEDLIDVGTTGALTLPVAVGNVTEKTFNVTLPTGAGFDAAFTDTSIVDKFTTVNYDGTVSFTVKARPGYTVEGVYANGVKLDPDTSTTDTYTIKNIKSNQAVMVDMAAVQFHTVTYVLDGAQMATQSVANGSNATSLPAPDKTGYNWDSKWYKDERYTSEFDFATEKITKDTILYGRYTPKTFTISYDELTDITTKTYGLAATLTAKQPTKEGHTFLGWSETPGATVASYLPGAAFSKEIDHNITLYAVWQKNTYTITFSSGEGYTLHSGHGSMTVEHGGNFDFNLIVAPAYAENEPEVWTNTTGVGTGSKLTNPVAYTDPVDGSKQYHYMLTNVKADTAVNVKVTANATYTVTFMTGTDVYQTQQVEFNHKATQPVDPKVEGYTFGGWYKDAGLTTPWDFATEKVIGPTTIYAKLDPITPKITWPSPTTGYTIAVKYTAPGAPSAADLTTNGGPVPYNSVVTFTITISTGYDASKMQVGINGVLFAPKDKSEDGKTYTFEFIAKQDTEAISVTGIERKTVTIIYNANARDDVSDMPEAQTVKYYLDTVTDNDKIIKQIPVRTGYKFLGWNTDSKADAADPDYTVDKIEAGTATSKFTANTTLYAVWKAVDTTVSLKVTDVAATDTDTTTTPATTRYLQYEGEKITLQATLNFFAKGTVVFYKGDETGTTGEELGSTSINGKTAELTVTVGQYKSTEKDEYYWVKFEPEADEGYAGSTSAVENVGILSKAICWVIGEATASELLVYKGNSATGTPITDAMIAGQTYTLKVKTDKITGVETLDSKKPVLGKDYKIVWQYYEVDKNDWTTVTESSDKDTYLVTGEYSGYQFRAQIVPLGKDHDSLYLKAAKYDDTGLLNDKYDVCLYTKSTNTTVKQGTATALEITGADDEAANVTINGTTPFTTIGDHKAQFEGQKVTLTATVKDTTTNVGVKSGEVKFFRYVDGTKDELLNTTLISVDSNGVATCEVEISKWTGGNVTDNKDQFYAVYQPNATYDTSASWTAAAGELKTVYIKSTTIKTPIIESKLEGKLNDTSNTVEDNTYYDYNLTGLLAGVEHTFTLRQTGAAATADNQFSVVAKDGRTVEAKNYDIEWQYKTTGNFAKADNDSTAAIYTTKTTKFGDQYRVVLKAKGDMTVGATSKVAEIGKKQNVTVAVEASADWVYQLNDITLTATVAAAGTSPTMKPAGSVTFYYKDGDSWVKLDSAALAEDTNHNMTASITTKELPVDKTENIKRVVEITAVYEGNETFEKSATATATGASHTIAATPNCTTTNKDVTVYSSVVYVDSAENTTNTPGTHGIAITTEGGKVLANETKVNLKLSEVYTLDHATDAADKALLAYGTDYTVQWQMLSNAAAYPDKAADGTPWTNITSATGTTCQIDVEHGAAYRAVITVKDTPIAKGSFTEVQQAIPGHKVYYSNILVAANAPATLTVNVNTDNTSKGYEGIVEGETVTIHTFTSGATGTTPISQLTVNIYPGKPAEVAAATTPVAPVFTAEKANVNGHVSFDWNKDVTPGYYTLKVKATFTNGYDDKEITRTLIVRDNDYSFNVTGDNAVYNGKVQGLKVTVADMGIENALAQKSVVVYYYTDEARTQQVEPTQAGTYYATVRLQESAYWTEKTFPATFTIKPREVSVVDLVAQAKVYDGTNNANIQEIILNDATVDPATGLPTDDEGIIDGDSVYAVGTGYTSQAAAGTAKLGVKDVTLKGDDAANYDLTSYSYTEDFNIQRSQVKGAIVSGRTYKYTGKDIELSASDIYLIDQAGNQLTNYEVTYYYHNGDGVEKVDAMNKMGKYTVIARPEQNNYKGGATETVYVGTTDNAGTLTANAVSSLITISNTVELYGAAGNKGIVATATNNATVTVQYQNGTGWSDARPTDAGRYLVKVTATNGSVTDTAYGIYTIVKARPEFTPTTDKPSMVYTSGRYDGAIGAGFGGKSDSTAETYITYTGGTIQGVAYEAPTEVGKYIATVHVGETANYTAHEKQVAFEITPKALTITADDISRQQYGAYPDLTASFKGLATGGVAADTSLRDVQIQPELIDDSNYTNDASDQVGNNYSITAVAALARNYTVNYVKGNMSVTREDPMPYLEIRGMIENGDGATDLAYYGDVIQLYAYGNQSKTTRVYNTSSILAWSVNDPALAAITQDGLLTVKGVGTVTVTLKRGIGAQQISTSLTFKAKKQEVKVVVPDQDLIYNGAEQKYDGGKFYAENAKGERITATPYMHDGKVKRTNVGSQIITSWVGDTNATYQSEHYCGLFTINVKDVTVTPNEISVTYGDTLGALGHSESGTVGGVTALTDGKAVSERDAYINLDVLNGYEILVAGRENENYNVKYVTDQDAPDVEVTAKALIISTGTLNSDGRTSGYLKDNDQFYKNEGFAITGTTFNLTPNDRMYGEVNPVMDYTFAGFVSGDSEADLVTLLPWLVKYSDGTYHNINGNANVAFDKVNHLNGFRATSFMSGMSAYPIDSMLLANSVKNYTLTSAEATQNIYQRPVTLTVPTGVTLTAYKPTIIDASGNVKTDVLLDLLLNNLVVGKYNDKGGLAELLKHTIKDLKIQIVSASYDDSTKTITATIKLGNTNYWTEDLNFTVKVDPTKIVAKYGPLGWTSASVTMVGVNEHGTETGATYVTGDVWYMIYTKDASAADKYSNYKDKTPVRKVKMTKSSSTGVYIANYDRLPAGEYVMFAIAEGYTIIE